MAVWLLNRPNEKSLAPTLFDRLRKRYESTLAVLIAARWLVLLSYIVACVGIIVLVGGQLGRSIFPVVDAGQFRLRTRA